MGNTKVYRLLTFLILLAWCFKVFGNYNIKKLEVLREHRPPPNISIIELLNDFCSAN